MAAASAVVLGGRVVNQLMNMPGMNIVAASELAVHAHGRPAADVETLERLLARGTPRELYDILLCWKEAALLEIKKAELKKEEDAVALRTQYFMQHARRAPAPPAALGGWMDCPPEGVQVIVVRLRGAACVGLSGFF